MTFEEDNSFPDDYLLFNQLFFIIYYDVLLFPACEDNKESTKYHVPGLPWHNFVWDSILCLPTLYEFNATHN